MTDHPAETEPQRDYIKGYTVLWIPEDDPDWITTRDIDAARIGLDGVVFTFAVGDESSAHDGFSVLVDSTGRRFLSPEAAAAIAGFYQVADKDLTAPPAEPSALYFYIVAAGATGAWAAKDGQLARYARDMWFFRLPKAMDVAAVIDEGVYYARNAANSAWAAGLPGGPPAGSVTPFMLQFGATVKVIGTANEPAGGESAPAGYIVGDTPSGDFSAFSTDNLAFLAGGSWTEYTPAEGDTIYNLDLGVAQSFKSGEWVSAAGALLDFRRVATAGTGTVSHLTVGGLYAFSVSTPPDTGDRRVRDNASITWTARAGSVLRFHYRATVQTTQGSAAGGAGTGHQTLALFRDSDVNAIAHVSLAANGGQIAKNITVIVDRTLDIVAADADEHEYFMAVTEAFDGVNFINATLNTRVFTLEELVLSE